MQPEWAPADPGAAEYVSLLRRDGTTVATIGRHNMLASAGPFHYPGAR